MSQYYFTTPFPSTTYLATVSGTWTSKQCLMENREQEESDQSGMVSHSWVGFVTLVQKQSFFRHVNTVFVRTRQVQDRQTWHRTWFELLFELSSVQTGFLVEF